MEVIDILTIIGYTITVFSLGYALGKEAMPSEKTTLKNSSNRQQPEKLQRLLL